MDDDALGVMRDTVHLFGVQVDVLVNVVVLELLEVLGELDEFVGAGGFVVRS